MARLAEVSVAPAEPLGDRAAELAFELDEVCSVLFAVCVAETEFARRAFGAYQLLWLEILLGCLSRNAILHAAEVGNVTLKALVVGELEDGPRL